MSNGVDQTQPPPGFTAKTEESSSKKRSSPVDNWLPPDWTAQEKIRTSGTKAGSVDKFYYEPVTGRKFRSKNEVLYYLEHGTPKKKGAKKAENGDTQQSEHSEGRGSNKRETRPDVKAKEPPLKPLEFDFLNVPEKVVWTEATGSQESWLPFIGDYKIQESVSQDWDRAFTLITAKIGTERSLS
ncbi:unnamed protein product [Cochlearia groenlandica]